jgi:hypothetical protein
MCPNGQDFAAGMHAMLGIAWVHGQHLERETIHVFFYHCANHGKLVGHGGVCCVFDSA